jgi:hypothetical protein
MNLAKALERPRRTAVPQGDAGQMEAAQMDSGQMDAGQVEAGKPGDWRLFP